MTDAAMSLPGLPSMEQNMEGGCTCRQVRYRLTGTPLIVHACHCRWCQGETGTAHRVVIDALPRLRLAATGAVR